MEGLWPGGTNPSWAMQNSTCPAGVMYDPCQTARVPTLLQLPHPCAPQEHGSPSPFWEQELESLHFVIEMKNEHIHGLDKKLLNLESVVGSRRALPVGFLISISSSHLNHIQKLQLKQNWIEPGSSLRVGRGCGCNATMLLLSHFSPKMALRGGQRHFPTPPSPSCPPSRWRGTCCWKRR